MDARVIELAITICDHDIEYVRQERKWWAARDNNASLDKKERKEAQRWVKVCTLVLESMYGTKGGKEGGQPLTRAVQFPIELEDKIQYLYMQATSDHKPYAEVMAAAEERVRNWRPEPKWTIREWCEPPITS